MNFLDINNRSVLRALLFQGDMLNTISGGVASTTVEQAQADEAFIMRISAPSVPAEAFQLMLNNNQLSVMTLLPEQGEEPQPYQIPMFYRTFELPAYIDQESIEAEYEEGKLLITLPFKAQRSHYRKIDIKHLNG